MRVFLIAINTGDEFFLRAEQIIAAVGAESYHAEQEFRSDGVGDPYGAVDSSDVVVWIEKLSSSSPLKEGEYNPLYGDTVLRRAVTSGKAILYYQIAEPGISASTPQFLPDDAKRISASLNEVEALLQLDLSRLVSTNSS